MGLGLGMKLEKLSAWLLHGMHLGLALSLPFLVLFLFGCNKVKEEKAVYGAEVTGEAIDRALTKAIGEASLDHVDVGQYLDHTVTRRIENEDMTSTLGGTRIEVIDRADTPTTATFTLEIFKSERVAGGNFETKRSEEPLRVRKPTLMGLGLDPYPKVRPLSALGLANEARAKAAAAERKITRISYHNLAEFTEPLAVPRAVAARAGCGGLNPCTLTVRYIRFDMVQWYSDGSTTKVALDFGFSTQPPYLPFGENFDQFSGLLVVDCRSTYVPIESRTVFVRDCMTLEDFQK